MLGWIHWYDFPWSMLNDPKKQWQVMPTFLAIEYCCFITAIVSLVHAIKNGKSHIIVWFAAFITGSANDIFFMALPLVDNFWQAQATVMLSPRLPLYICCIYNLFLYYSTVTSWRIGFKSPLPEAIVTAFLALFIYYPYDLIGAKHLWWTWHTTDPCVRNRIQGVPIGSSMWILTFSSSFSLILYFCQVKMKLNGLPTIIFSAIFTTPMMMVVMSVLQLLSLEQTGVPSIWSFSLCIVIFLVIAIISVAVFSDKIKAYQFNEYRIRPKLDLVLGSCLLGYFSLLMVLGYMGSPETFTSTGVHQVYGPCNVMVIDFTGLTRDKYVCQNNIPDEWNFSCLTQKETFISGNGTTEWYKICGTGHRNKTLWVNFLTLMCGFAIMAYSFLLIYLPFKANRQQKVKER